MATKLPRFLQPFALIILSVYAVWGFFKLIQWLIPSTNSREFALWLAYGGPTLFFIGIVVVSFAMLFHASVKQATVPLEGTKAPAKYIGAAIANSLTRYQAKHAPTPEHSNLTLSLADFESALRQNLPKEAYTQSSWWTDVSAHSQQWLTQGCQVLDTKLTDTSPHVVFGSNLPPTE
jgi:hypothetical protein